MLKHLFAFLVVAALAIGFVVTLTGCATYTKEDMTYSYKAGYAAGMASAPLCRRDPT